MIAHQQWTDSAASYVLDALDAEDRAAFETHLESCPACRADVQAYREVAGAIAHAAPPRFPPATLRERVLSEARKVRPLRREHRNGTAVGSGDGGVEARTPWRGDARSERVPQDWRRPSVLAAAAGIVLAIALGSLYVMERARRAAAERELAQASVAADAQRSAIAAFDSILAGRDSLINAVFAEDVRTVTLTAPGQPPSARIFWNRDRGTVIIAAYDLPPAPAGRTYQLWGIRAGQPISMGTFNTDAEGRVRRALRVEPGLTLDLSAITEEPAGGSPLPTTQPFLVGAWPAN